MKKLWQKNWKLNVVVEAFETKGDLAVDQKLILADVLGSLAHAQMLAKIGILSQSDFKKAQQGLTAIAKLAQQGKFNLELGDEDVHTKIENYITAHYGEAGKKIHAGRSRNDQVATAMRLYTKAQLLQIWQGLLELAQSFLAFAQKHEMVAMPGYTHMQKAMPSSLGMWAGAFTQSLLDDLTWLTAAYEVNNQSPLGSAAAYGVPLALDRAYTAKLLGFAKVQTSSLYCQNSRGKNEAGIVAALISILLTINKFASDVLLFTTSEFSFFSVADELVTGSSIMPQKKNLDVAELLRSKAHVILGNYVALVSLSSNLISGYNRDLQDTKKPLIESLNLAQECLQVAKFLLEHLQPKVQKLTQAMTPEIFATHQALSLVTKGTAFRNAYQQVAKNKNTTVVSKSSLVKILKQSKHLGGTGNLGLSGLAEQLAGAKQKLIKEQAFFQQVWTQLLKGGENYEK